DAKTYSENNTRRHLIKNAALQAQLSLRHSGTWERSRNGILVPIMSVRIDTAKVEELFSLVVRGLFMFHWGVPLHSKWYADVTIIRPEAERLQFANHDAPIRSFTKLSAVTRPDMSLAPFTGEEAGLSDHRLST
ncbi:MAG TPA: hypothetical protein VMS01_07115, partial [Stellaceae bacterium]|nr:hypothetical protein [Stellaceae bacterium]